MKLFLSLMTIETIIIMIAFIILFRNKKVHHYRIGLLNKIEQGFSSDSPEQSYQKLDYFKSVSYNKMVLKFWKPINSFYDEEKFN